MTRKPRVLRPDPGREYLSGEGCFILECSNVDADPQASIARARVAPGVTTRWHRLRGTSERYLILQGRGRVEVGDGTGEEASAREILVTDVAPGDVVLIPAMCRQRIANTGTGDLVFLAICTPRFREEVYEDLHD